MALLTQLIVRGVLRRMNNNDGYGVVYTPSTLSDYVARLLINEYRNSNKSKNSSDCLTILDPACGEGALLSACDQACTFCNNKHFVGIDVDKCVINGNKKYYNAKQYTFIAQDTLLPGIGDNSEHYWKSQGIEPDLIIANPPWSSEKIYDRAQLSDAGFKLDVGQYDSYVLFIELCLKLLKPNGYAAFIIPDSIFASENKELRKYLSENTELKVISRLGEKIFQGVNRATTVIIVKKSIPNETAGTTCFRLTTKQRKSYLAGETSLMDIHEQYAHVVYQKRFRSNSGYIFDIDTRRTEEALLDKMASDSIQWNKIFHFGRGVEVSKSGTIVMCPYCKMAQGFSKRQLQDGHKNCVKCGGQIIVTNETMETIIGPQPHEGYKKIYVGENLHRYSIRGACYIKMGVPGINYKEEKLYEPPKMLIRKTGLGINACIDYESTYISQTVYSCNYLNPDNKIPLEYFLGVLNSRVLYYFYLKKYGENEWKSHPYFTKEIIFSLPIPSVTPENSNICTEISQSVKQLQREYSRDIDLQIERMVAMLYKLTHEEFLLVAAEINRLPDLGAINHMKMNKEEICLDI